LANKPRYYWDACSWIGLINQEPDKIDSLNFIIEEAQKGKVEIWTSAFTLAEVFKRKCSGEQIGLEQSGDADFEDYLAQDFVQRVQVDSDVGTAARRLLRKFPSIRKPQDAIHAATAALNNVDELHTFDGNDLIALDGQIPMANGKNLKICRPPIPPPPPPEKMAPPLLELMENKEIEAPASAPTLREPSTTKEGSQDRAQDAYEQESSTLADNGDTGDHPVMVPEPAQEKTLATPVTLKEAQDEDAKA